MKLAGLARQTRCHVDYTEVILQEVIIYLPSRGARSAGADARLCTSSDINLIVSLSSHLVR